ncbi:unnamed protein product [Urochloa humidicola]
MAPPKIMSVQVLAIDVYLNQNNIDMALMPRECFIPLGIEEGPQDCLVAARFSTDSRSSNLFAHTVSCLMSVVPAAELPLYHVAVDVAQKVGYILCPDDNAANSISGRKVTYGDDTTVLQLVKSVQLLPFGDDVNQHKRAFKCI